MKKTILVIDDFETTLFTVEMTLKTKGYNVLKAGSGEDALKLLDGREINLILSDYNMPGMNGAEFTENVRKTQNYKNIPIVVLSTDTSEEKKNGALEKGATGWLKKPYKLEEFLKVVERTVK